MNIFPSFISFFRYTYTYSAFVLLTTASLTHSFVFRCEQWERGNQTVLCLSSTDAYTKYSKKQRDELADYINMHNAHIIVEDVADYNGKNQDIQNYINQLKKSTQGKSFLIGIKEYLHSKHISETQITNIEYRHAAHAAFNGKIALSTNDVMEPAYSEYNKGWKYSDEEAFKQFYNEKLQEYRQYLLKPCRSLFFYMYWRKSKPLKQVLTNAKYYQALDSVVSLLNGSTKNSTYDKLNFIIKNHGNPLICIKIARAIARSDNKNIIVCATEEHIKEINKLLAAAHYKHTKSKKGTIRIGPKTQKLPHALRLHKLLKKKLSNNRKTIITPHKQYKNTKNNRNREKDKKNQTNSSVKIIIFLAILLLVLIFNW